VGSSEEGTKRQDAPPRHVCHLQPKRAVSGRLLPRGEIVVDEKPHHCSSLSLRSHSVYAMVTCQMCQCDKQVGAADWKPKEEFLEDLLLSCDGSWSHCRVSGRRCIDECLFLVWRNQSKKRGGVPEVPSHHIIQ